MFKGIEEAIPITERDGRILKEAARRLEPYLDEIAATWHERLAEVLKPDKLPERQVKRIIGCWLRGNEFMKKGDFKALFRAVKEAGEELIREGMDFQTMLTSLHLYEECLTPTLFKLYPESKKLQKILAAFNSIYHGAIVVLASSYFSVEDRKLREYSATLEEKVKERTRELWNKITVLTGLHDISDMLREEMDPDKIYREVTKKIAGLMNVDKCCIILYDKENMEFIAPSATYGMEERYLEELSFTLEDVSHTFEQWEDIRPLISNNPAKDEGLVEQLRGHCGEKSLLLAKLLVSGEFLGFLRLADKQGGVFTEDDASLAEIIASRIGAALYTMRLINELRESEEYLRHLKNFNEEIVKKSPLGIFRLDRDMRLIYENPAARKIMQVPDEEESSALGMDIRKVPSVVEAGLSRELDRLLRGEEVALEVPFRSIYGREAYLRIRGVPLIQEGRFDGAILMVEDVTERIKTEETLRYIAQGVSATTGKEFFKSLVQHLAKALHVDYAFVGELKGGKGDVVETVAVSAKGGIGENFVYMLKGSPCSRVMEGRFCYYPRNVKRLFIDDSLLAKMGAESYMGMPLRDSKGRTLGLIVAMHSKELSNPKLAESMLRIFAVRAAAELERRQADKRIIELSHFPERNPNPVFKILKGGEIVYYNPAVFKIVDDPLKIKELLPADYVEIVDRVVNTGRDARIEHKARGRVIEYIIWPVSEKAVHAYGRDVTQRKQAEKKLRRAYEELKSVDELKSNIVANVSHELRTPITIALGALELLKQESVYERRKRLIEMTEEALVRQNMIVGDLIDASMMEKHKFKLKLELCNLVQVINMAVGDFKAAAQQKRIDISLDIEEELPSCWGTIGRYGMPSTTS